MQLSFSTFRHSDLSNLKCAVAFGESVCLKFTFLGVLNGMKDSDVGGRVLQIINRLGNCHKVNQIIKEAAQTYGVSVPHLKKLFKIQTSKTIIQCDKDIRLEKAIILFETIETTYMQINEVCDKVHYGDVSHFIKDFKHKYGLTPKKFQKQCWRNLAE